jgi:hypothetical protein
MIFSKNKYRRNKLQEIPGAQTEVKLKLRPLFEHARNCTLQLVLSSVVLREGDAKLVEHWIQRYKFDFSDDDIMSTSSMMSVHADRPMLNLRGLPINTATPEEDVEEDGG